MDKITPREQMKKIFDEACSKVISVDEYCSTIEGADKYKSYLCDNRAPWSGMIKWPDNDNPENWGGPFPGNYVAFSVYDHSDEKLKSPVDIHKEKLHYAEHSTFCYPKDVFYRVGLNCNSNLSDSQLILVYSSMTPEEKMISDINKAKFIGADGNNNPYKQISTVNPCEIRLYGTDDCSYTCYFNYKTTVRAAYIINNPCWCLMCDFVFTN